MLKILKKNSKKNIKVNQEVIWGILGGFSGSVYVLLTSFLLDFIRNLGGEPLGGFVVYFIFFSAIFAISAVFAVALVLGRPLYLLISHRYHEVIISFLALILTLLIILVIVILTKLAMQGAFLFLN